MSRNNGSSNQEAGVAASTAANAATAAPLGRASWSGFLRLSLVVVPVKAYPAVSTTETISFNQLLLHQALHSRGKVALGQIVLSGHRHVAVLRPTQRLLALHLLHDPTQVRSCSTLEASLRDGAASQEEQQLAAMLVDSTTAAIDWSKYRDDTAEKLSELIEAKIAGRPWVAPTEEPVQVLQLLDALKQSVATVREKTRKVRGKSQKQPLLSQRRSA
jgi:DNA end-binding protein Ku